MKGPGQSRGNRRAEQEGRGIRHKDHAVSEVVSIVLLLAVAVVGVGLVAVTIYSQPTPEGTPQVDILVSEKDGVISLTHNGGDTLAKGSFYVLADGVRLDSPVSYPGGAGSWSLGGVLQYDVGSAPERVQVVYRSGGGATLLKSATFSGTAGAGGPDIPAGGEWVESELNISFDTIEEREAWVVDQFVTMLEGNSIYLSQNVWNNGKSDWGCSGSFEFTLNDSKTYLELATDQVTFAKNDVLRIGLTGKSAMRFFAIGHGGWHISAANVDVYKNGVLQNSGTISGGRIYDYSDFSSSVVITSSEKSVQTEYYVNNTQLINGMWSAPITLTNIKPADPTLMILDISDNDPCYFIGAVESITGYP
ncbi:MAG: hypothetical protein CVV31_00210 [Methanomicrobiales archaeon HGW-Methanomicrobiales-2]|jgi:hypothetical protein|nr:MAG: hypothetical protein CVV31_00210 [Methanomicrobiales archaeon HGW-Methanomicrobiales-2]